MMRGYSWKDHPEYDVKLLPSKNFPRQCDLKHSPICEMVYVPDLLFPLKNVMLRLLKERVKNDINRIGNTNGNTRGSNR
jgi:hypothetical protein